MSSTRVCVRRGPARLDLLADGIAVVTLVGVQDAASRQTLQEQRTSRAISDLSSGQQEGERTAEPVGEMDLGRASTTRAADSLALLPPFAPDAQRCAFTAELSMST